MIKLYAAAALAAILSTAAGAFEVMTPYTPSGTVASFYGMQASPAYSTQYTMEIDGEVVTSGSSVLIGDVLAQPTITDATVGVTISSGVTWTNGTVNQLFTSTGGTAQYNTALSCSPALSGTNPTEQYTLVSGFTFHEYIGSSLCLGTYNFTGSMAVTTHSWKATIPVSAITGAGGFIGDDLRINFNVTTSCKPSCATGTPVYVHATTTGQ